MKMMLIPAVYLAAVLDTSLGPALDVGPAVPDMLAVVALIWSLTFAPARVYLVAATVGFVSDLVSPGRPAAALASYAIVGYLLPQLPPHFPPPRPLPLALPPCPPPT